ncbi:MAG: hydantoinase/oxoprolinase family protein [Pseudomonadales bacterium]
MLLGIDTGGTFTDFVLAHEGELRLHKVLSTPANPADAILAGIEALGLTGAIEQGEVRIIHGSTVATNATLEGKGVPTAYVTNRGFTDTLLIARQARSELYNLTPTEPKLGFDPAMMIGTGGRLDAQGRTIEPLTEEDLSELVARVQTLAPRSVAINLLFSYLDDRFERQIEARLSSLAFVSRSSFVLPEYREYERGVTTWLNAWLGPLVGEYLEALERELAPSSLAVMQSSGGTIAAALAARRAANLLVSGPAGGLAAACYVLAHEGGKHQPDSQRLLTFDMGGTSTDVSLVDGAPALTTEGRVGPYPVAIPMADIHTIGAGGGSIAYLDEGGALNVGPQSAGAAPGPACYGLGGQAPTVTDAHVVLGRLPESAFLGGRMALDVMAARAAMQTIARPMGISAEDTALGVLRVVNERMTQALRVISVERGYDPREFVLVCFGGAAGLHVCELAEALGNTRIMAPVLGGVLSALGMLVARPQRQLSRTVRKLLTELRNTDIEAMLDDIAAQGELELELEGHRIETLTRRPSLDLRYRGQSFALNLDWSGRQDTQARFHALHRRRYGHALTAPVELVNVRLQLEGPAPEVRLPSLTPTRTASSPRALELAGLGVTTIVERRALPPGSILAGPAIVTEDVATTLIKPGWRASVGGEGHLAITRD